MKNPLSVQNVTYWNRKFHIYIGLFLALFILFFSLSGLLLNHGQWKFASFWQERKESELITPVNIPDNIDSTDIVLDLMKQLNLTGEISNVKLNSTSINFRVARPGTNQDINVDFKNGISVRKEMVFNLWGKMRGLHTFNGSDRMNLVVKPNWLITHIWRLTMDAIAMGMIFLCISSWIMWYKIREKYPIGLIILILGITGSVFFIFLLPLF